MTDQLFTDQDLFSGDPLAPDLEQVCPASIIATLTRPQREQRVRMLIEQAHMLLDRGWEILSEGGRRTLAARCVMFSGGNDSTVLAHLVRHRIDYAVHCDTTIGIEETEEFVRDLMQQWGIPLIVKQPPVTYEALILERVRGTVRGFPGPAMHFFHYHRLKQRAFRLVRNELVSHPRSELVVFIAGRRREESDRRADVPFYEREGSIGWISPLAMWTKLDLNTYRLMAAKDDDEVGEPGEIIPINPASARIHMSGECLCGAYAKPGELSEIRYWFPRTAEKIDRLQRLARAAGALPPYDTWGHGKGKPPEGAKQGKLCSSCSLPEQLSMDPQNDLSANTIRPETEG